MGFNIQSLEAYNMKEFLIKIIFKDQKIYLCCHPQSKIILEIVTFVVVTFRCIWEMRNKVIHEGLVVDVATFDHL